MTNISKFVFYVLCEYFKIYFNFKYEIKNVCLNFIKGIQNNKNKKI